MKTGIHFIINDSGQTVAVQFDVKKYRQYIEDILDGIEADSRKDEERISIETVKAKLKNIVS